MAHDIETKKQRLLQLEAEHIELAKQLEVRERLIRDRKADLDSRTTELIDREAGWEKSFADTMRRLRDERERFDSTGSALEDGWRALEEAIQNADLHVDLEKTRLRESLSAADVKETLLRDAARDYAAKERDVEARRRRLGFKSDQLRGLDADHLSALQKELRHRESLLAD